MPTSTRRKRTTWLACIRSQVCVHVCVCMFLCARMLHSTEASMARSSSSREGSEHPCSLEVVVSLPHLEHAEGAEEGHALRNVVVAEEVVNAKRLSRWQSREGKGSVVV